MSEKVMGFEEARIQWAAAYADKAIHLYECDKWECATCEDLSDKTFNAMEQLSAAHQQALDAAFREGAERMQIGAGGLIWTFANGRPLTTDYAQEIVNRILSLPLPERKP